MEMPNYPLQEWTQVLKPYQKEIIEQLIENNGEERAIELWLSSNGPSNTVQFGGNEDETNHSQFIERFKTEFRKFICGHPDYEEDRKVINGESPIAKGILVSIISAAIGAKLGILATLLAPAVVIMLSIVGKMTVNAYCAM